MPGWQGQGEMKWRVGQGGLPLVTLSYIFHHHFEYCHRHRRHLDHHHRRHLDHRRSRQLRCHLSGGTWVGEGPRPQNDSRNHQSLQIIMMMIMMMMITITMMMSMMMVMNDTWKRRFCNNRGRWVVVRRSCRWLNLMQLVYIFTLKKFNLVHFFV